MKYRIRNFMMYVCCLAAYAVQSLEYSRFTLPLPLDFMIDMVFFLCITYLLFKNKIEK